MLGHFKCNVGLVVEYDPASVETRVRFPDVAFLLYLCYVDQVDVEGWVTADTLINQRRETPSRFCEKNRQLTVEVQFAPPRPDYSRFGRVVKAMAC